jgi:hypothetical protein
VCLGFAGDPQLPFAGFPLADSLGRFPRHPGEISEKATDRGSFGVRTRDSATGPPFISRPRP